MLIYYCLYALFLFFAVSFRFLNKRFDVNGALAQSILYSTFLFLLLALRHPSMGMDLGYGKPYGYISSFETIASMSWKSVLSLDSFLNYEIGFVLFNKIISVPFSNPQWLLVFCALLSLLFVFFLFYKKSANIYLSTIIYLGLPTFGILYSGLRQGIAIGIISIALYFGMNNKNLAFISFVVIASLFHSSALVFLVAFPLLHITITKRTRWISVFLVGLVFLLRYPLFELLSKVFKENATSDSNGSYSLLFVFLLLYIICCFIYKENDANNGMINMLWLTCICLCFTGVYSSAIRIAYYFMLAFPLLVPHMLLAIKDVFTRTIAYSVIVIAFSAYGLKILENGSWMMSNPYHFFWV